MPNQSQQTLYRLCIMELYKVQSPITKSYNLCWFIFEPHKSLILRAWLYSGTKLTIIFSLCRRSPGQRQCGGGVTPSCPGPGWRRSGRRADTWSPSPGQHRWHEDSKCCQAQTSKCCQAQVQVQVMWRLGAGHILSLISSESMLY